MAGKPKLGGSVLTATREELAYAGGLFDGEGCISQYTKKPRSGHPNPTRRPRLRMAMTDEDPIRRFHGIVSVGTVRWSHPPAYRKTGRQAQYVWTCGSFEDVQHVLAVLWPWLSRRRQARAVAVMRAAQTGGAT